MPAPIDLTGRRFGRLTAVGVDRSGVVRRWECRCECGATTLAATATLTTGRVVACPGCSGGRRPRKRERTCAACGRPFLGGAKARVCSAECSAARRRGRDAGVDHLPPPTRDCVACGRTFRAVRNLVTCSEECLRTNLRAKHRESYRKRAMLDPNLATRAHRRSRERAAADPVYAATLAERERRRREKERARSRGDPAFAERYRERARAFYVANSAKILAAKRARLDRLSPAELDAWLRRSKAYGREYQARHRAEIAADPERHRRYLDFAMEYRRRRAERDVSLQLMGLQAELQRRMDT